MKKLISKYLIQAYMQNPLICNMQDPFFNVQNKIILKNFLMLNSIFDFLILT